MAIGDIITASDYNNIKTDITSVIGKISSGYGQDLRSPTVASSNTVTSENMRLLYLDLMSARIHQTGILSTTVIPPTVGNLIAWDTSTDPDGVKKGLADFISVKNLALAFDSSITPFPDTSFSLVTATSSSRNGTTNPWGTVSNTVSIVHTVTFTFTDANHMQYFFNAGGQVRFFSSIVDGSGAKTLDWANMLLAMGTVFFGKSNTQSLNNSGIGTSIGYTLMTSTYQLVYSKYGSSVYSDNVCTIEARRPSTTTLQFRITFNDADTGTSETSPVDESVNGTITSVVQIRQPNSSFTINSVNYTAVTVSVPSSSVQTTL
jgi:hypothetical protein